MGHMFLNLFKIFFLVAFKKLIMLTIYILIKLKYIFKLKLLSVAKNVMMFSTVSNSNVRTKLERKNYRLQCWEREEE